jgi:SlyX protein
VISEVREARAVQSTLMRMSLNFSPGPPMESRLIELETKLAFAEDMLDTLNTTVFRQQERIDLLERQLRLLHQQIQALRPEEERDLRDEIPPHY